MTDNDRSAHWEDVYTRKSETDVSWFEASPDLSFDLIGRAGVGREAAVIDVGGGASRLVDALVDRGFVDVTVLDLSRAALETSKRRLGPAGETVDWIVGDATTWVPTRLYDLWHDRAAFHFLTDPADRSAYLDRMGAALRPGGYAIFATFALDGPERCSGLEVARYDGPGLAAVLGDTFEPVEIRRHHHTTPSGVEQRFLFALFRRRS